MDEVEFETCRNCGNVLNDADLSRKTGMCQDCQGVLREYWLLEYDEFDEEICQFCGKALDDWSDLGCGRCDRRHPEWGLV